MADAYLEVKPASGRSFSFPLEAQSVRIGRDPTADLVLDDPLLSKLHARLELKDSRWTLLDEGSRNGTFVAGKRAPEKKAVQLKAGDDITLGLTAIRFHEGVADENAPPLKRQMRSTQEYFSVQDLLGKVGTIDVPEPLARLLVRLAEEVIPESEPTRIHAAVLKIATEVLKAGRAVVLSQTSPGELAIVARHPATADFEVPPHFLTAVVQRRGVVLMREFEERKSKGDLATAMALPLFSPNGVMGVLYVEVAKGGSFDESSAAFGSVIAGLVGPAIYQAQRVKHLHTERAQLLAQLRSNRRSSDEASAHLLGSSQAATRLREQIGAAARHTRAALVSGEIGTGKESIARAIHNESSRRERAFVPVLCGAHGPETLTRELLGDGTSSKPSLYQLSVGGTLFLDDVAALPLSVQTELHAVLSKHQGEAVPRVIASSTKSQSELVAQKLIIEPLGAMIGATITAPPLRERREDIPVMARHIQQQHAANLGKNVTLSGDAIAALERGEYRANVSDLSHIIERAMIVVSDGGVIDERHVQSHGAEAEGQPLKEAVAAFERTYVLRVLAEQHGHRTRTAKTLGLSRQALSEKLRKYGLREAEAEGEPDEE